METKKPIGRPAHEVCAENCDKPKLIRKSKNGIEVWLQWFGESEHFDLSEKQFLFPINAHPGEFFFQPEEFEVIMVGKAKDWPNDDPEVVANMVLQFGGPEKTIVYFISSKFGVDDGQGGTMPAAGAITLDIQLADDNCGLLNPQSFFDDTVRTKAVERFQKVA